MLLSIERVLVLKSVHTFKVLSDEQLMELACGMGESRFEAGETLMQQGDGGRSVFVIVSGEVEVIRDGVPVTRLGEREIVGELAALDPHPRSATVTATRPTHVLELDNHHMEWLMAHDMGMLRAVIQLLCRRLRAGNPHNGDRN